MYTVSDFVKVYSEAVKVTFSAARIQEQQGNLEAYDFYTANANLVSAVVQHIETQYAATLPLEGHLKFMLEIVSKEIGVPVEELNSAYRLVFEKYNESLIQRIKDAYATQRMLLALKE